MTRRGSGVLASVLAVFTLVPGLADASPPSSPGTADGGIQPGYRLEASVPRRICVGTDNVLSVRLVRVVSGVTPNSQRLVGGGLMETMPDVVVDAVGGAPVVSLQHTTRVTGLDGSFRPPTADFAFHAEQAGEATVRVTAHLDGMADFGWQGPLGDRVLDVAIPVVNCRFKVSVFSRFAVEGEADLRFAAGFTRTVLEPSDDGELRQSVTLTWLASVAGVGDCLGRAAARTSEVVLLGSLDAAGVLTVEVRYEPFTFQLAGNCGGFATDVTPSPLRLTIGPQSGRLDQELTSPFGGAPGSAVYLVEPMEAEP